MKIHGRTYNIHLLVLNFSIYFHDLHKGGACEINNTRIILCKYVSPDKGHSRLFSLKIDVALHCLDRQPSWGSKVCHSLIKYSKVDIPSDLEVIE